MLLFILSIALWVLAGLYFYYYVWTAPKRKVELCNVAIAGSLSDFVADTTTADATKQSDTIHPKEVKGLANKRLMLKDKEIDAKNFIPFVIQGSSMKPVKLESGSIALVRKLEGADKFNLSSKSILVFKINEARSIQDNRIIKRGFKVREFLSYANLTDNDADIVSRLAVIAPELSEADNKEKLYKKLNAAKVYFGNMQNVTISRTYKGGNEIDYSIHSPEELVGIVKYVIPENDVALAS